MQKIIDAAIEQRAAGTLDFPGYMKLLISAGVNCYTVDLETLDVVYYAGTKSLVRTVAMEPVDIAGRFSEPYLKEAIMAARIKTITYPEFLKRIAAAGVESYEVDFKKKEITYRGRRKFYIETLYLPK